MMILWNILSLLFKKYGGNLG